MTELSPTVQADSHLTLHYRISLAEGGDDVVSTFGGPPATLQMGLGQLAEPLERCLMGLAQGAHSVFTLPPGQAYGERNPALVQRVSRAMLQANAEPDTTWEPGDLVEFPAPGGGRYAGILKQIDEHSALFDFNHPLAGHAVRLEVRIIAVL
jgi:FKBP-type peptidyl-prolyl cis-trans isomerase SlpA